jgi:hypothetical protein
MRLFLIPMSNLSPLILPEPVVSFRLTFEIFRVLTKDDADGTLTPSTVLDYLNMHHKKLIVMKSSPFQISYSSLSLG